MYILSLVSGGMILSLTFAVSAVTLGILTIYLLTKRW